MAVAARVVVCLALLWFVGCDDGGQARIAALTPLIGQSEQALIGQLGVPTHAYEANGVRYLTYVDSRVDIVPDGFYFGPPYYAGPRSEVGPAGWYGATSPPAVIQRVCETTFEVVDGKVRSFALRGNACG